LIGVHHGPGPDLTHKSFGDLAARLVIELPGSLRLIPGNQGSGQESKDHETRRRVDLRHNHSLSIEEQKTWESKVVRTYA
jgi:hypothetical protein